MTMISAYLQAEEIDPSENASFYCTARARVTIRSAWVRPCDDTAGDPVPEFYRMLKELSDELDVEALEDQNNFES